jgi:histidinol phosphatase-like PHP family hydrolase
MLPPDNHVHTQWSWDADAGSMEGSCARAVELGLPSIAFTEHVDHTRWVIAPERQSVRRWPAAAKPCDPADFEEEYRAVLRALARSGRALEISTRLPARPEIVRWWHEAGGEAVSFGSDAHQPPVVARGFQEAAAIVEAQGFGPGRDPHDFWRRRP